MKSKVIIEIVAAVAVLGGGYTVTRMDFIGTGKVAGNQFFERSMEKSLFKQYRECGDPE